MSAMYASRFPGKVRSLVLAGAPIETDAGNGPIKQMAHRLPMSAYRNLVAAGGGRMRQQWLLEQRLSGERKSVDLKSGQDSTGRVPRRA